MVKSKVIDEQLRGMMHDGNMVTEDVNALLIRPVVEDISEVVNLCTGEGLLRKEIVSLISNAIAQYLRHLSPGYGLRSILHDK